VATPQQRVKEYLLRSSHVVQAYIYAHQKIVRQTMERWLGAPSDCDGHLSHLRFKKKLERQSSKEGSKVITFTLNWI
jgi:hypothetical protein